VPQHHALGFFRDDLGFGRQGRMFRKCAACMSRTAPPGHLPWKPKARPPTIEDSLHGNYPLFNGPLLTGSCPVRSALLE
jgi:hypothetical protein